MSKNATCGRGEETKKRTETFMRQTGFCLDHPRRRRPLKFCMRGRVQEVVIYFKFHENRSRGLRAVGVENRPLPLIWPMAYSITVCTTVQAVSFLLLKVSSSSDRVLFFVSLWRSLPVPTFCRPWICHSCPAG